jgi:hypothetical protein
MRQLLFGSKEDMKSYTVIVGDFNTTLSSMDRPFSYKISSKKAELNSTIDQKD